MFDITILPLLLIAGRERSELPGLYVAGAPRKAARLRTQDQLMLFMSLTNNTPGKEPIYSPAQQQEMLTRLAETFFTTSGSVTAGMRAVVARLNDFLLGRNLRAQAEGQVTGSLNLAVLHGSTLLLAHAGATQSMLIGKTQVQVFDDHTSGRGLGLSKQLVPRFYQMALEPGDILLISAAPPDAWKGRSLAGATQLSLDHLRRRLLGQAGGDITAVALKFQTGKGQVIRYRAGSERAQAAAGEQPVKSAGQRPQSAATQASPAASAADVPAPVEGGAQPPSSEADWLNLPDEAQVGEQVAVDESQIDEAAGASESSQPDSDLTLSDTSPAEEGTDAPPNSPVNIFKEETPLPAAVAPRILSTQPSTPAAGPVSQVPPAGSEDRAQPRTARRAQSAVPTAGSEQRLRPDGTGAQPANAQSKHKTGSDVGQQIGLGLKSAVRAVSGWQAKIMGRVGPLVKKVLPERSQPMAPLSPTSMLFIAICVPLVVVAIATTVYLNAGRAEQLINSVDTARQYVQRAEQQVEDPTAQRESWKQALLWLDKADQYGRSEDAVALRTQALAGIDTLDGIVRIAYREAVSEGFAVGVNITRMAATLNDIYLLDSTEGRVLRIYRVGNEYAVDPNFVCGPGDAGGKIIGPLIDISVLPPNNQYRASVMATDVNGNLVYCSPGQGAYDSLTMLAPDTNWGNIKAIEVADGMVYVLDPLVNAVWYIFGNNVSIFDTEPRLFFTNQIPQMDDLVDFTIDKGFLYLLHSNGEMTTCEASGFELSPTRCDDPAPYGDARIGRDSAPLYFEDAHFIQMQATQPPDPSLFILDDTQASIYHFSLRRLNLQRQYRAMYDPDFPLPERPPTAFVVTPNRRAVLAYGNLIFFAPLP